MPKFFAFALVVVVVLALALGAVGGITGGVRQAWSNPEVVHELARQEAARAESLYAQAAGEQAKADKARADAESAGAWSRSSQLLAIEAARRWPIAVSLVLVVVAVVSLGAAVAVARWSWLRSSTVALPGGLIAWRDGRAVVVFDPSRMIGGVLQIDGNGVLPVLQTSEELAADVARAALVARAVETVGSNESRAEIAAKVTESLSTAFSNLAGAHNMTPAAVGSAPALRLVRVHSESEKRKAALIDDTAELREFVEEGAKRGYQRREWAGYKFRSTGRPCSQTRWATLAGWLGEVGLLKDSRLVCDVPEALQRLGYDSGNTGESEVIND